MNTRRALIAAVVSGAVAPRLVAAADVRTPAEFPSLTGASGWLNSPPLTTAGLRGKVVLVDFWTYSCINWLRSLPYVRAWAEKYKNQGLVVIGVHTPEFEFEKDIDNVRRAVKDMRVDYPVAIDSEAAIWRAFRNEYWPALYLIDAQGRIRHHHFGEGDYEKTERVLQQLLLEADVRAIKSELATVDARGAEAPADWEHLRSPENYVGYGRTQNFASPGGASPDRRRFYAAPARLKLNQWALSGEWSMEQQFVALNSRGGRITYRFHARDLHLVMGPVAGGPPIRFRVRLNGEAPGADRGLDVDEQGNGVANWPRLHQLIRQARPVADQLFEIEFLDPAVQVYSFTFG